MKFALLRARFKPKVASCPIPTKTPDGNESSRPAFDVSRHTERMKLLGDLKDARLIYLKGALFGMTGVLAAAGLLAEAFSWRNVFLLGIVIWSFCRLYYFAFYVIEHYVDANYKFAGLFDFMRYLWRKRRATPKL